MDDQRREDWEHVTRSLGAGFLARWDEHDPESLEQEIGPTTKQRAEQREFDVAWFG